MISNPHQGSFRLFRFAGIDVYLHWLWLVVAFFMIEQRRHAYTSLAWNIAEYLALFLIVLLHEFGHSFATRQVGGTANTILLWPLGGVAYVSPPPRPGAELWAIAAGPLVNVVLLVVLTGVEMLGPWQDFALTSPNAERFLLVLIYINILLLKFNLLPIYPLDGGQILRALLWFVVGRVRSLYVACVIGFIGVAGLALYAWNEQSIWLGVITFYVFQSCLQGWQHARALAAAERGPQYPV